MDLRGRVDHSHDGLRAMAERSVEAFGVGDGDSWEIVCGNDGCLADVFARV